jgi:hypothetical protein
MAKLGQGIQSVASSAAAGGTVAGVPGAIAAGGLAALTSLFSGGGESGEEQAVREALAELENLDIPPAEKRVIKYEMLQRVGTYNPELEADIVQGDTELKKIVEDPTYKAKQQEVLANLITKTEQGLDASDMAARNQIVREVGREASARNDAVLTGMARRGMLGSGAELAAKLSNEQVAAERAQVEGEKLAATRAEAMRDALAKVGKFATDVRGQEYDMSKDKASAQDVINKYNTSASRDVQERNIYNKNFAKQLNLKEDQRIADANVGTRNTQAKDITKANMDVYADKVGRVGTKLDYKTKGAAATRTREQDEATGLTQTLKGIGDVALTTKNILDEQEQKEKRESEEALKNAPFRGNR